MEKDRKKYEETNKEEIEQERKEEKAKRIRYLEDKRKFMERHLRRLIKRCEGNWLDNYEKEIREEVSRQSIKIIDDEEYVKIALQDAIDNELEKRDKKSIERLKKEIIEIDKKIEYERKDIVDLDTILSEMENEDEDEF